MSANLGYILRDGRADDLDACVALDHSYRSDYVWQMGRQPEDGWMIRFRTERLPRPLASEHPFSRAQLSAVIAADGCFLVVQARAKDEDDLEVMGYAALIADPIAGVGRLVAIVVAPEYRRHRIGTRLLGTASLWSREHDLRAITFETTTRNHPSILFCQQAGYAFCGFNDQLLPERDIALYFSKKIR